MRDDLVRMIDPASAPLYLLESICKGQRKQTQGNDRQSEQTAQQTSIRNGFQMDSRIGRIP
jgi:hypothetical protein